MCTWRSDVEAYLGGTLPADREGAVLAHLESCLECQKIVDADTLMLWAVPETAATSCPSRDEEHLAACASCRTARPSRKILWLTAAAAAAIALGLALFWSPEQRPVPTTVPAEDMPELIPAAFISVVHGGVRVADKVADVNHPVRSGDIVVTGPGQRAKIEMPDGSEVYVNENTVAHVIDLRKAPYHLDLEIGDIVVNGGVIVDTSQGTATTDRGEFNVRASANQVVLTVADGEATFRSAREEIRLLKEQQVLAREGKLERKAARAMLGWLKKMRGTVKLEAPGLPPVWKLMPPGQPVTFPDKGWIALKPVRKDGEKRGASGIASTRPVEFDRAFTIAFDIDEVNSKPGCFTGFGLTAQTQQSLRLVVGYYEISLVSKNRKGRLWSMRRPRGMLKFELTFSGSELVIVVNGQVRATVQHDLPTDVGARVEFGAHCGPNTPSGFEARIGNIRLK